MADIVVLVAVVGVVVVVAVALDDVWNLLNRKKIFHFRQAERIHFWIDLFVRSNTWKHDWMYESQLGREEIRSQKK